MSIQGFSQPSIALALWAADPQHQPHEVRAYLSSKAIWFIPCLGSYKGATEMSYLTYWHDFMTVAGNLCSAQESTLCLGAMDSRSRRKATLVYNDGRPDADLGVLYSIPAADVHKHDAWTIPLQQPSGGINAFVCGHVDKFGQTIMDSLINTAPGPDPFDQDGAAVLRRT